MRNPFKKVNANTTYALTERGGEKSETGIYGGELTKVLVSLQENGASSASNIAEDTGMRSQRVLQILEYLEKNGYVRHLSKDEFDEAL